MKIIGRLESTETEPERLKAFEQLTDLFSKDPRALRSYIGHRQLETLLMALREDSDYLPS